MLECERHAAILALLRQRTAMSVGELASQLEASEATIRRDIAALAERGELVRVRGGATLAPGASPVGATPDPYAAQKRAVARAAAGMIEDGQSIIINGGTTTQALTEFLAGRELNVFTNSLPIACQLLATSKCRISVPGGALCRDQNIILSPFDYDTSEKFWASEMYTSAFAVNRRGVMECDPLVVQACAKLLGRAERLVVLADSRKLRQQSSMVTAELSRVSVLITDSGATDAELAPFRDGGVKVIVVPVPG